jgi:hypothetical protein
MAGFNGIFYVERKKLGSLLIMKISEFEWNFDWAL